MISVKSQTMSKTILVSPIPCAWGSRSGIFASNVEIVRNLYGSLILICDTQSTRTLSSTKIARPRFSAAAASNGVDFLAFARSAANRQYGRDVLLQVHESPSKTCWRFLVPYGNERAPVQDGKMERCEGRVWSHQIERFHKSLQQDQVFPQSGQVWWVDGVVV